MSVPTCDHLKEDGVYCDSPALRGRNYCYFHLNLRGCSPNLANPAHNSLRLNILPASPTGSIFCADFRLSPIVFSIFYEHRGRGEGYQLSDVIPFRNVQGLSVRPGPATGS